MRASERLRSLYYMMSEDLSCNWYSVSSLTRRLIALGIISEMRLAIEDLEKLNLKLDIELSVEDADIDCDLWLGDVNDMQYIFNSLSYVENKVDNSTINKMPDLFPIGKSTTFTETTIESLKTGMRQLCSEAVLNHADIVTTLKEGFGRIVCLVREIKEKMTNIPDELYENFCDDFFSRDLDLAYQEAERDYLLWKDEHDWKSIQALEDKRTQEILKLIQTGVFIHSTKPTNREVRECPIKIQEGALEYNTKIPENIDVECARFGKFVFMKDRIMWCDYKKLGKYLYRHYKDISFEEMISLKFFSVTLDFIHHDMASLNSQLLVYLPDYEDNELQAVLDNAIGIINTCKPYLNEKIDEDFLGNYVHSAYYGELRQEVQKKLGSKSVFTNICKMLGMLKVSAKVFKVGTTSEQLAACISSLTEKPKKSSLKREIDNGAVDKTSRIWKWTDAYIKEQFYSKSERLFMGLSEK